MNIDPFKVKKEFNCKACDDEGCDECCLHSDHDHGICLDCGTDIMDKLIAEADFLADVAEGK